MRNLVICELLKLRRSKMLLICILGAFVAPILMFVNGVRTHYAHPDAVVKLADFFNSSMLYSMLMFSLIVFAVIGAFLFSREYSENTLKTIITIPVAKSKFIISKFVMLLIVTVTLTLISWTAICALAALYHALFGLAEFTAGVAARYLGRMILGGALMFLTLTPFAFLSVWTKGLVVPIISAAAVALGNVMLSGQSWGAFFPWTASYLLASGEITKTGYSGLLSASLIAVVAVLGFFACTTYFKREDIR